MEQEQDSVSTSSLDFATFLHYSGYELKGTPFVRDGKYVISFNMERTKMDDEYKNFVMSPFYTYTVLAKNLRRTLGKTK